MNKLLKIAVTSIAVLQFSVMTVFAGDNRITSYAFADIAGSISGDTITVNVPYSTKTTYWDHIVQVSDGATFVANSIRSIDDTHSVGEIVVTSDDGNVRTYTVKINKNDYKAPTYSMEKAKSIKSNSAKVTVNITKNDAVINRVYLYYYTKKNSKQSKTITSTGETEVELTGLKEDTKYYYYLSVETDTRTYDTSAKSFTTKSKKDTGTNSSSNSKNTNTSSSNKNTNSKQGSSGPATDAKKDEKKKNEWSFEDGNWLYYGADGYSKTGWYQVGDKWYYTVKGTNKLKIAEWAKIDGNWYCFDAAGAMLANTWIKGADVDVWYYVDANGSMLKNQEVIVNGVRYVLDPSGICMSDEFIFMNDRWLYAKPNAGGLAVNEQFTCNGSTYNTDQYGYIY